MPADGDGGLGQGCSSDDGDKWLASEIYFGDGTHKTFMYWI